MSRDALQKHLLTLLEDYKDFNSSPIETQQIPTALEFSKQVSRGYPCVYKAYEKVVDGSGKASTWIDPSLLEFPAMFWTEKDLISLVNDTKVEVAVTPNGRADDIEQVDGEPEPVFLSPATVEITMSELLAKLARSTSTLGTRETASIPVYYLQSQNSNLTTTPLFRILKHVPENFSFAQPVLSEPEAINIWIGDERSVTSTHRDPYENLYLVLKGSKTFTLYPPADELTLPTKSVRTGRYNYDERSQKFSTILDEAESPDGQPPRIPWVSVDPLRAREELIAEHSVYQYSTPRRVVVHEGEILYLPSGWYHHVQQEAGTWDESGRRAPCIAVNYWYDMDYEGEKYIMRQLIGRLAAELRGADHTG